MWVQISHNDLDGIACLLLGRQIGVEYSVVSSYDSSSKYYFNNVLNEIQELFSKATGLLITDINLTPELVQHIEKIVPSTMKIISIDHHEDSIREHDRIKIHHNLENCAAYSMYRELEKKVDLKRYNDFVDAVNAFDTWRFDLSPFGLDMQRVFYYYVFMDQENKYVKWNLKLKNITELIESDPPTNTYKPEWYIKYHTSYMGIKDEALKEVVKNVREIGGVHFYPFEKNNFMPAFEVSVYAKTHNIDNFVFLFEDTNSWTVSLRTNSVDESLQLNEFARTKGGGGHKNAASFRIPRDPSILESTINEVVAFYSK